MVPAVLLACGTCLGACLWYSPACGCLQYLSACISLCLLLRVLTCLRSLLVAIACRNYVHCLLVMPACVVMPAYGTCLLYPWSLPGSNTCLPCLLCLLAVPICLLYLLAVRVPAFACIARAPCLLAVHFPVVHLLREVCLLCCVCSAYLPCPHAVPTCRACVSYVLHVHLPTTSACDVHSYSVCVVSWHCWLCFVVLL